jgi:hypothetical protein
MTSRVFLAGILSALALTGVGKAQTGSGVLSINANVQGSISITFLTDPSGMTVTGAGTNTASLALGIVSMYGGTVPSRMTRTVNGASISFNLSTPIDIRVDLSNSPSTTYTLSAMLGTTDIVNVWTLGPTDISSGASFALASAGIYGAVVPYTLKLTVPAGVNGTISNTIAFLVVAN